MTETLLYESAHTIGDVPDVELAPGINMEQLKSVDEEPMFVTLRLLDVGARSRNGFTWDREGVERVMAEINQKKPEGGIGHVKPEDRSTKYDVGSLRWVGATMRDGALYGKAYIPKFARSVREHFATARALGHRVGTSIYGRRGKNGLADLTLESIDLAHPDRLGYAGAAVVPHITSETRNEEREMPEEKAQEAVAEQVSVADANEQVKLISEIERVKNENARLTEVLKQVAETMNWAQEDVLAEVKTTREELNLFRQREFINEIDALVAEQFKETPDMAPVIRDYLIRNDEPIYGTIDEVKERLSELLQQEHIQNLAKMMVARSRGPAAIVAPNAAGDAMTKKSASEMAQDKSWLHGSSDTE